MQIFHFMLNLRGLNCLVIQYKTTSYTVGKKKAKFKLHTVHVCLFKPFLLSSTHWKTQM